MNSVQQTPEDVITFWFQEITPKQWWATSDDLDWEIESRFGALHYAARHCELYGWRESAKGRLAEIIVLDQFSRNIYRNHLNAFAYDNLALALAQTAVDANADHELDINQRAFFYMPYMHSESLMIHEVAVALFNQPGMKQTYSSSFGTRKSSTVSVVIRTAMQFSVVRQHRKRSIF